MMVLVDGVNVINDDGSDGGGMAMKRVRMMMIFHFLLQPSPKFFHAATILDDVMVIYGGRSTADQFSSELLAYRINCNSWRMSIDSGE